MQVVMRDISEAISIGLSKIRVQNVQQMLSYSEDMDAIVSFYCAAKIIGEDIISYENETIELLLLQRRISVKIIRKVIMVKSLIGNLDGVLSVPEYLSVAIDVLNDDEIDPSIIDHRRSEKIVWATILLMSISGSENIPITGAAVGFVAANLKAEGWTMPPLLLDVQKISDMFEYYDPEYYDSLKCSQKEMLLLCKVDSGPGLSAHGNFNELHKPIFHYIAAKAEGLNDTIGKLCR